MAWRPPPCHSLGSESLGTPVLFSPGGRGKISWGARQPGALHVGPEFRFIYRKTRIIGRCAMSLDFPLLVRSRNFYFFLCLGGGGKWKGPCFCCVFTVFLTPFPEKGILDSIAHRPIIQVFTGIGILTPTYLAIHPKLHLLSTTFEARKLPTQRLKNTQCPSVEP